jgi:hypothetical protein
MKVKEFLLIFGISLIITYIIAVHKFTYTTVLEQKYIEEPEYRLYRYKQSDIVLTHEEFQYFRIKLPNDVYISEKLYFFVFDDETIRVDESIYNKYEEGSKINYLKTILFFQKEIQ